MADKLFLKYGIEDVDYQKAVVEHNIFEDEEVKQIVSNTMQAN